MTKEMKHQKLVECKANAFDSIVRLYDTIDSNRNFHRLCRQVIASVETFERTLNEAPTTQCEQFPCMNEGCKREATCQGIDLATQQEASLLLCDECANALLHKGVITIVEENFSETQ